MKKREIYHIAQMSVLSDDSIPVGKKLETLRVLMAAEDLAEWEERLESEDAQNEEE